MAAAGVSRRMACIGAAALLLLACGDGSNEGATRTSRSLLDELTEAGDRELFDATYASSGGDGSTVLAVGVRGDELVGYLCDPSGSAHWFSGALGDPVTTVTDGAGGTLTVDLSSGRSTATGVGAAGGTFVLAEAPDLRLSRQSGGPAGSVGGLIVTPEVVVGTVRMSTPGGAVTVGIEVTTVADQLSFAFTMDDIFVVLMEYLADTSEEIREDTELQRQQRTERLVDDLEADLEALRSVVADDAGANGAIDPDLVAAALAASAEVAIDSLFDNTSTSDALAAELAAIAAEPDGDGALAEFLELHDPTHGQVIADLVEGANGSPPVPTSSPDTPTLTAPPPGDVEVLVGAS